MPTQVDEPISNANRFLTVNASDNVGHSTEAQAKALVREAARFDYEDHGDSNKTLAAADVWKEIRFQTTAERTLTIPAGLGALGRMNRIRIINDAASTANVVIAGVGTNVTLAAGSDAAIEPGNEVEISLISNTNMVAILPLGSVQGATGPAGPAGADGTGLQIDYVVADETARLALSPATGEVALQQDNDTLYRWNGSTWDDIGPIGTNADWAALTNKPLWADLPNERAINNAGPGNPITLTQTNVNEGHWHYVNTNSSAVTVTLPNGLSVVSGEGRIRCLGTFWCVSYSNPVSFVIGSDYTDSTNGGTITAASQVYSLTASQDVGQALPNIKIVPGLFA